MDELYARQHLVQQEAERLERELDALDPGPDADRCYILALESEALWEESTKLGASISEILDRDLQR